MRGEYWRATDECACGAELPPRARRIPLVLRYGQPTARNYLRVRGEYFPNRTSRCFVRELPPRARRIHALACGIGIDRGTTSACAENTNRLHGPQLPGQNYLRVRGEYRRCLVASNLVLELPPRARRIRARARLPGGNLGTTSACAENTNPPIPHFAHPWNYLRVRGEYTMRSKIVHYSSELPPRARRIRRISFINPDLNGTTSACAENTRRHILGYCRDGNYLRVRGEYASWCDAPRAVMELPPRARRIPPMIPAAVAAHGTTSACAENTAHPMRGTDPCRNYLRVRGEYRSWVASVACAGELPPRARRIHSRGIRHPTAIRTTSACAENTSSRRSPQPGRRNYLRVRGEYGWFYATACPEAELPPRARRIRG